MEICLGEKKKEKNNNPRHAELYIQEEYHLSVDTVRTDDLIKIFFFIYLFLDAKTIQ